MKFNRIIAKTVLVCMIAVSALVPFQANAQPPYEEATMQDLNLRPHAGDMAADALLVRPAAIGATIVGTALFLVSLPFSIIGGNVGEAADTLIRQNADFVTSRCLGCVREQYETNTDN